MDYRQEEAPVRILGAVAPAKFPHLCPYQLYGASREMCKKLSSNYQRNLAGCCGTKDRRDFPPCNSVLRKCVKCLEEGKGGAARVVTDVQNGLCHEHAQSLAAGLPGGFVEPSPLHVKRRTVVVGVAKRDEKASRITSNASRRQVKERTRNRNLDRAEKLAALTEASQFYGGKPRFLSDLVTKAVELLSGKNISIEPSTLYSFATGKLSQAERTAVGLKEKKIYNRDQ